MGCGMSHRVDTLTKDTGPLTPLRARRPGDVQISSRRQCRRRDTLETTLLMFKYQSPATGDTARQLGEPASESTRSARVFLRERV